MEFKKTLTQKLFIKVIGIKISNMVKEEEHFKMEIIIMVILNLDLLVVMVFIIILQMDIDIKDTGQMIYLMDMELKRNQTEKHIKANLKKV
jgi:hypothetical protein